MVFFLIELFLVCVYNGRFDCCCQKMTKKEPNDSLNFDYIWSFLSDFFINSPNPWKARLLLAGSVLCSLIGIGLGFALVWWCFPYLYAAFMAKNTALLLLGAGAGLLLVGLIVVVNFLGHYLKNTLMVDWRSWLTKKIIKQYLGAENKCNYLDISREHPEIDNPGQRIHQSIEHVVESSLNLSTGLIEHLTKLIVYIVLISLVGGSLSFVVFDTTIIIPQFMLLTALLVGITTSIIGYYISKSLQAVTNEEITAKSNLGADLSKLSASPEEIAIERGESYYQNKFNKDVSEIDNKTSDKLYISNKIVAYNYFISLFQSIIPFLAAAPLYFQELISIDMFSSIGYYFSMITSSISWFIKSFDTINIFKTNFIRIQQLQQVLMQDSYSGIHQILSADGKKISVKQLNLKLHGHEHNLFNALDFCLQENESILIKAESGFGKSSIFKAIAGTWHAGDGEIHTLNRDECYFLPQKAHLPDDTLRNAILYPNLDQQYSDVLIKNALKAVRLEELCEKLDENIGFKSEGQKQRIAFARVILKNPKWLFLDEATASLDDINEQNIYQYIREFLPQTTVISIAHRPTVEKFHDKILFFKREKNGDVAIQEVAPSPELKVPFY